MPRIFELNEENCTKIVFEKMRKLEDQRYFVPAMFKENEGSVPEPIIIQLNRNITTNDLETEDGHKYRVEGIRERFQWMECYENVLQSLREEKREKETS